MKLPAVRASARIATQLLTIQLLVTAAGEITICWTSDGHQFFVRGAEDLPIRVYRLDPISGRRELVKELMPADRAGLVRAPKILLTPDGKSYVYDLRRNLNTSFSPTT